MMRSEYCREEIRTKLDTLLASHDRLIRREIDASSCRTSSDWRRLHEAQDQHQEALDVAVEALLEMVLQAERCP